MKSANLFCLVLLLSMLGIFYEVSAIRLHNLQKVTDSASIQSFLDKNGGKALIYINLDDVFYNQDRYVNSRAPA
jgi:hypothetical protein